MVQVQSAPFPNMLPGDAPGKTMEDGPSPGPLLPILDTQIKGLLPGLSLAQLCLLRPFGEVNQHME